ncbi:MAG: preprotein translocase subunit SecE [Betaproteobacteria bacterium]|nr:MAG: preprotein translocase subunit SecE [Betaproteobacteria bacterium]
MNDTAKNWLIVIGSLACVGLGVFGFYRFAESPLVVRLAMILGGLGAGAGVAYLSTQGKTFVQFARESIDEAKKVAWPTRSETVKMTMIVFVFAVVMAIFLFAVDTAIGYLIAWLTKRG